MDRNPLVEIDENIFQSFRSKVKQMYDRNTYHSLHPHHPISISIPITILTILTILIILAIPASPAMPYHHRNHSYRQCHFRHLPHHGKIAHLLRWLWDLTESWTIQIWTASQKISLKGFPD